MSSHDQAFFQSAERWLEIGRKEETGQRYVKYARWAACASANLEFIQGQVRYLVLNNA